MHRWITEQEWLDVIKHIATESYKAPDDSVVDICNEVLLDIGFQADWDDSDDGIKIYRSGE